MSVMVIGGAGYLGSSIVSTLSSFHVDDLIIVDKLYFGIDNIREFLAKNTNVKMKIKDIRSLDGSDLIGVDHIINVGGLSNDPTAEYNPEANMSMNIYASNHLVDLCCELGTVKSYIYASSCSIYDFYDSKDEIKDESCVVNPKYPYSISKKCAEDYMLQRCLESENFNPIIFRMGTLFGCSKRMRYDLVVNALVKDAFVSGVLKAYMLGAMWRPLLHVDDAARAYAQVVLSSDVEKYRGKIINLSSDNFRISEVVLQVHDCVMRRGFSNVSIMSDFSKREIRSYRVSNDRSKILGFMYEKSLREGIEKLIDDTLHKIDERIDLENEIFYNIVRMKSLDNFCKISGASAFDAGINFS